MGYQKLFLLLSALFLFSQTSFCWGFYAHRKINYYAVFLLPPGMMVFYKSHIAYLSDHAVDPDKRRYVLPGEAPRHFIDLDHYGPVPFDSLPRKWEEAVKKYSIDSLQKHGTLPWWLQLMQARLTRAFREKDEKKILKLSAEIGHYIADAHVPLHTSSNHNGQLTGQQGVHGFWESRVPELLAEKQWNFFIGRAFYIKDISSFIRDRIRESAAAADTVLSREKELSDSLPSDPKYAFENRRGTITRQYSAYFSKAYDRLLLGMIERRMRQSILSVASCWFTAWSDAGQPILGE